MMDNRDYFHGGESARLVVRYDKDRGHGGDGRPRHDSRLALEGRSYNGNDGHDRRDERKGGTRAQHQRRQMLLQPALGQLYEVLSNAHSSYEGFSRGYDEETRGIRPYAGPEILDRLWSIRAKMGDRSKGQDHRKAVHEDVAHPDHSTNHAMSFRDCAGAVQDAFAMVMDAAPSFKGAMIGSNSTVDAESVSRMVKKVDVAYRGMSQLMRTAHRRQTHLTELVTEIELLLVYLDRVKPLWDCHATRAEVGEPPRNHVEHFETGPPQSPQDIEQGQ